MVTKDAKTMLFASLIATIVLSFSVMTYAQIMPGEEDTVHEPVIANKYEAHDNSTADITVIFDDFIVENMSATNQQIEHIFASVELLEFQNEQLESVSGNGTVHETIARNNIAISELWAELDEISPPTVVKEISSEEKVEINAAREKLLESDLPILGNWVDSPTGKLTIEINMDIAESDILERITEITGEIPLIVHYTKPTATFQGCDNTTGLCNPHSGRF